jgi:general secretion pathway protein D
MKPAYSWKVRGRWLLAVLGLLMGDGSTRLQGADEAPREDAATIMRREADRQAALLRASDETRRRAVGLMRARRPAEALALVTDTLRLLPLNPTTEPMVNSLLSLRHQGLLRRAAEELGRGDLAAARESFAALPPEMQADDEGRTFARRLSDAERDPPEPPIEVASPDFVAAQRGAAELSARGRTQLAAGDWEGAQESFREMERRDPSSAEARSRLREIAQRRAEGGELNRSQSRSEMLAEVAQAWQRPGVREDRGTDTAATDTQDRPLAAKLAATMIPSVSFNGVDLARVVATLSELSEELDVSAEPEKGVNIVLLDPAEKSPLVSLTLRNLSLKRVLDFVTDAVGYQYEIQADAVVVRPGGEISSLDTAFFPVARSTVIRMTGPGAVPVPAPASAADPFAFAPLAAAAPVASEAQSLRGFLQQAGVNFDSVAGSSLAYDGSAMIVTQTTRNLERIRNILNRYNDVRQVEIEAKFIEVQEGALEELGITWNVTRRGPPLVDAASGAPLLGATGRPVYSAQEVYSSVGNRSLADAYRNSSNGNAILIDGQPVASTAPPTFPGAVLLGGAGAALADVRSVVADFDVNAIVRALSQKQGTDLLSAPKVTVLSGNPANIVVAQELRYPQSFGEIQSQVGSSNSSGSSGSAGVTVTAGTPRDFTTRNVGVELRVTPTVEEDDYSISLDLNPKVTEFEGFVEYGGPSLAISSGKTVTVPPGFYQPIFSVREVSTKVTLWDGATLVMGGLTREEVRAVHDRVPILGSIPILGRAFRSKGESAQKRNLLIFVTANLVSPGGSFKKQTVGGTAPSARFQNPTVVTPRGPETRR